MNDLDIKRELRERLGHLPQQVRTPLWRRVAWIGVAVLVVIGVAWWIHTRPAPQQQRGRFAPPDTMPVGAAPITQGDIKVTLNALGTVTPLQTVTVKTQINGQLTQVFFTEGQTVHKGDSLAEIDTRPYALALEQAQGQLARDDALLNNANVDLARYKKLFAEDSVAQQTLATQEALVRQYEGTVKIDQSQVDNAKLNLVYCHITSPITGKVGLRLVDPGNYVQVGDTTGLLVITQMQPITVIFTVPEDNVPAIMKQLRAGATLQVTAYNRSDTTLLATGKLMSVDNQIDTSTGTLKLRAQFDNDDETLYPNQFVNTKLLLNVLHDATIAPTSAIQRGAPGTFVYLVKDDGTVGVQPVKLGPIDGDNVQVLSGLKAGDRVVVDGADKLRDGAKVAAHDVSKPAAGAAPPASPASAPATAPDQQAPRQDRRTP
ncbi:MAG: MdtA/MuxA family multidrug efflux RND transporter periplasmic adaptor subunit [Alphaproteobacteria bacterium]|nr:MdtA/MuxA family multidrug efflux RND transporter periplasmic adaptor subunit [Alphaproteobacteria bacterium]